MPERAFAQYIGKEHALFTSSCRSALYLTYKSLKLKGEVIVSPLTSASGHDFIEKMLQDIFDDYKTEVTTGPKTWPSKECWTHLLTDLFIILTEGLKGNMSIRESLNTLHGCEWAICNKDDPLPFILEIALSPIIAMRRI